MNRFAKKNCIHVPEGLINDICLQRVTEANGTVADSPNAAESGIGTLLSDSCFL